MKSLIKVFLLVPMIVLMFCSAAGCSKKDSGDEVKATDYLEWTAEDWSEASEDQKEECAVQYTQYAAELAGIEDGEDQAASR